LAGVWGWNLLLSEDIWGLRALPPEARRSGNGDPVLGDFCNFLIKITYFYAYFGQDRYFKAITYQLKAFKISL